MVYSVPQKASTQAFPVNAPMKGMRVTDSFLNMQKDECIYSFNLIPTVYGMKTRLGYAEQSRIAAGSNVWSILPYVDPDSTNDKLFAVTSNGIYDVTAISTSSTLKVSFGTTTGDAGYGAYTHFVNDSGGSPFMYFADEENGLYDYDPSTNTWAAATGITFPGGDSRTVADLVYVVSHKLRLWFIAKDSNHAYYLGIAAKAGALTRFDFGNKFKHGGHLVGLYNWTIDGGDGVDDYLVAVSSGGDAVMYRGEDPSSAATWTVVGSWYIGPTPAGRRIATEYGGDLFFLTAYGIVSAKMLLQGINADVQGNTAGNVGVTKLIKNRFRDVTDFDTLGWELTYNPVEGEVVVIAPQIGTNPPLQYIKNISADAWAMWRGPDIKSFGVWHNQAYFGDSDKKVWYMRDGLDGSLVDTGGGTTVDFSMLTAYSDLGQAANFKQIQLIHPYFLNILPIYYEVKALYDFDLQEILETTEAPAAGSDIWDTALWDSAIWDSTTGVSDAIIGQAGIGRKVAIAVRGKVRDQSTLISFDVYVKSGGVL